MIDVNELRKGVTFESDNELFRVLEYEHHKPGRGKATIRIKARNLRSGTILEKSFISSDRVKEADLEFHNVQYLYNDGSDYHFMDQDTYEQPAIPVETIGDAANYLVENLIIKLTFYQDKPLDIELPITVDLKVVEAEVAVRGDTATGVNKKVTTETGLKVQVPNFIEAGDVIRVDTRSGTYITRAKVHQMETPAGKECSYFFGDYYRGRDHEECRLLLAASPPQDWTPDLCFTCPVPEIQLANACPNLILEGKLERPFPFFKKKVKVSAYCSKTLRDVAEPKIGCGECHPLPPIFSGVLDDPDSSS